MLKVPGNEIAGRVVALQALLVKSDVDAAIIRQNADIFYFTGTVQDAWLIVPASGQPRFLVRKDVQRALTQSPIRPIVPLGSMRELPEALFDACSTQTPKRIGLELDVLPTNTFLFFDEKLFPKQVIVDISGLVRQVRMVKSPWEIEMMRKAGAISQVVYDAVPGVLREGMSELELSAELEAVARKAGSLGLVRLRAFNMDMYFGHVLAGPDGAVPSYADAPTGGPGLSPAFGQGAGVRRIERQEIVSVDSMVSFHGYLNDQTRNFSLDPPPQKLLEAYRVIRDIHFQFKGIALPGAVTGELYATVCQWARDAGYGDYFMGYGDSRVSFIAHGLGVEVDEFPFIAQGQKLRLEAGMTLAFEPKFIIPDTGVVGLENTYLVTESGLESLNTAPEDLRVL